MFTYPIRNSKCPCRPQFPNPRYAKHQLARFCYILRDIHCILLMSRAPFQYKYRLFRNEYFHYKDETVVKPYYLKTPVTPCRASLASKLRGTFLLHAVLRSWHAHVSISHGSRPGLPAGVYTIRITCRQAQNLVRVNRMYLHINVIANHQQGGRKGRNFLVINPLKDRRGLYTTNLRVCGNFCEIYWDVESKLPPSC